MRRSAMITLLIVSIFLTLWTTPSFAATTPSRNGKCQAGEVCFYYNSNQRGSLSDFTKSVSNYGTAKRTCFDFRGAGSGKGKCVKNNSASVWNRTGRAVLVYSRSNYKGKVQTVAPGARKNLNSALKNENASHKFQAKAKSFRPACDAQSKRYFVQEGSVSWKVGYIDTNVKVCYDARGNITDGQITSSADETGPGSAGGFNLKTLAPREIGQIPIQYVAQSVTGLKVCLAKVIPVCLGSQELRVTVYYYAPSLNGRVPGRFEWEPSASCSVEKNCDVRFSETA